RALLAAGKCRLLVAFLVLGKGFVGDAAFGWLGHRRQHNLGFVAGRGTLARLMAIALATAAATPPPPLAAALTIAAGFRAGRLFVGETFGLFGLDLGFGLRVERLVVLEGVIVLRLLRRRSRRLRRQQRFRRFQRVNLLAAVDDEGLLAADGGVGDDGQRDLETVLEVAQMAAL